MTTQMMRRFWPALICAASCIVTAPSRAQTPPLEKWKVSPMPAYRNNAPNAAWTQANNAPSEWEVFMRNGSVAARPCDEHNPKKITLPFRLAPWYIAREPHRAAKNAPGSAQFPEKHAAKVSNGWLLWVNHGEWGGRVEWFSPDGTRHYKVSNDQIAAYAKTPHGLFAVQGLAHLGMSQGTLLKLTQNAANKWEAKTIVDLKDAPFALLPENGAFVIVTSRQLVRVVVPAPGVPTLTPLVQNAFWWGMYPNSLVLAPNGDYYIGMRGGIVRVFPEGKTGGYQMQWLTAKR